MMPRRRPHYNADAGMPDPAPTAAFKGPHDEQTTMRRLLVILLAIVAALVSGALIINDRQSIIDVFTLADPTGSFGVYFHLGGLAVNLAVILASKGHYQEALEYYARALEVNPDQPMTHINMARAFAALGRNEEAGQHYQKAGSVALAHADALAQQGRLDEAAAQFREAIQLIPDNAEAHCHLGMVLVRQGKFPEAREQFVHALRIRSTYTLARDQLQELESRP